MLIYIMFQT